MILSLIEALVLVLLESFDHRSRGTRGAVGGAVPCPFAGPTVGLAIGFALTVIMFPGFEWRGHRYL